MSIAAMIGFDAASVPAARRAEGDEAVAEIAVMSRRQALQEKDDELT